MICFRPYGIVGNSVEQRNGSAAVGVPLLISLRISRIKLIAVGEAVIEAEGNRFLIGVAQSWTEPVGKQERIPVREGRKRNLRKDVFGKRTLPVARDNI